MWDFDAETQTGCHLWDADNFAKDRVMASLEDNTTLGQKNTWHRTQGKTERKKM